MALERLNPLRFADSADETAFFESFCVDKLRLNQGSIFLAGLILYAFFLWDQHLDPVHWQRGQAIRGLVLTPGLWLLAALMNLRAFRPRLEALVVFGLVFTSACLGWIAYVIESSSNYGTPGYIIVLFCVVTLTTVRLPYYVVMYALSWGIVSLASLFVAADRTMLLTNQTFIAPAIFLCLASAATREMAARRQFRSNRELQASRDQVANLLGSMFAPEQIERLARRASQDIGAPRLFISYRRADSDAITGRIRDRLVQNFGEASVFMDVDRIPFGTDFRTHLVEALKETDLVLAVIGPKWAGAVETGAARLHAAEDPVRMEIETALGLAVPVIPILVGGAAMPNGASLPASLGDIAFRNAAEVSSGRDFHDHIERLIRAIDAILESRIERHDGSTPKSH